MWFACMLVTNNVYLASDYRVYYSCIIVNPYS